MEHKTEARVWLPDKLSPWNSRDWASAFHRFTHSSKLYKWRPIILFLEENIDHIPTPLLKSQIYGVWFLCAMLALAQHVTCWVFQIRGPLVLLQKVTFDLLILGDYWPHRWFSKEWDHQLPKLPISLGPNHKYGSCFVVLGERLKSQHLSSQKSYRISQCIGKHKGWSCLCNNYGKNCLWADRRPVPVRSLAAV